MTTDGAAPADPQKATPSPEAQPAPPLGVGSVITTAAPEPAKGEPPAPEPAAPARPSGPPPAPTPAEAAVREQIAPAPSVGGEEPIQPARLAPATVLVIDVGGTNVKILATGQTEP